MFHKVNWYKTNQTYAKEIHCIINNEFSLSCGKKSHISSFDNESFNIYTQFSNTRYRPLGETKEHTQNLFISHETFK